MSKKLKLYFFIFFVMVIILISNYLYFETRLTPVSDESYDLQSEEYSIFDIEIFSDTDLWDLAKAIDVEDERLISKYIESGKYDINYQEPSNGFTLLHWAVVNRKVKAIELLLSYDVDINTRDYYFGSTPLIAAIKPSLLNEYEDEVELVRLLLENGADPNFVFRGTSLIGVEGNSATEPGSSPLMISMGKGFEKTKLLVSYGAEVNYKNDTNRSPMTSAVMSLNLDQLYYIVVEMDCDIYEHMDFTFEFEGIGPEDKVRIVRGLRSYIYPLDSVEYEKKMEIVERFTEAGIDYFSIDIPWGPLRTIKAKYGANWEEYAKVY